MREKMSKPSPPAPTASAIGPCPTVIQIVGRPGTGSLPSTIAPPDHPCGGGGGGGGNCRMVRWCWLGKLPEPGCPAISNTVGQGPIALAVGAGGDGLDIFTLICPFSSFSLSSGDGPI